MKTKSLPLLLAGLLVTTSVYAQQTFSDDVRITGNLTATGNVGIGTTSPAAKLHILNANTTDAAILATSTENNKLIVRSESTQPVNCTTFRFLHDYNGNRNNGYINFHRGGSAAGGFLTFGTNGTERLIINSNGNVGIGTTGPTTKLHVAGDVFISTGSSYRIGSTDDSGNRLRLHHNASNAYIDYSPNLYFRAGTSRMVTFSSNGDVGIGTTNPTAMLDVAGRAKVSELQTSKIAAYINDAFTYDGKLLEHYSVGWYRDSWESGGPTLWQSAYSGMKFFTSETARMVITFNGNVGIGLTNPTVKLDVNGVIRAHEVKVCLNQGCDYVFEDDYQLMSLSDLSSFVKTNKHLPDIAPAAEMEAEGINLSEMNTLLLRKIEELTLYIIEQDRRAKNLEQKVEALERQIEK